MKGTERLRVRKWPGRGLATGHRRRGTNGWHFGLPLGVCGADGRGNSWEMTRDAGKLPASKMGSFEGRAGPDGVRGPEGYTSERGADLTAEAEVIMGYEGAQPTIAFASGRIRCRLKAAGMTIALLDVSPPRSAFDSSFPGVSSRMGSYAAPLFVLEVHCPIDQRDCCVVAALHPPRPRSPQSRYL